MTILCSVVCRSNNNMTLSSFVLECVVGLFVVLVFYECCEAVLVYAWVNSFWRCFWESVVTSYVFWLVMAEAYWVSSGLTKEATILLQLGQWMCKP